MCEMLGISAKRRLSANGILRTFFSHAEQHPHGWGLATFPDGVSPAIDKEPVCASRSAFLKGRLDAPIEERTLIAHIRFATVGHLEYANCHPFSAADNRGRIWTLAHNGTIFNGPELNDYIGIQYGDTDSERVLLHLIDRIDREQIRLGRSLEEEERFGTLAAVIAELSKGNKLNLLFTDGKYLYVHTNCRGTMHCLSKNGITLISTQPLSDENWQLVPFGQLLAFNKGKLIKTGTEHHHEYIHSEDEMKLLYQIFANL